MAHHHPKNTTCTMAWCNVCNKNTPHNVASGRLGSCQNTHVKNDAKKPYVDNKQDSLF